MSLTYTKQETPAISKLIDKTKKSKFVYISQEDNGPDELQSDETATFFLLPYLLKNQRDALFISAPSGSGISVFAGQLQKHKGFQNQPVCLFTSIFE